MDIRRFSELAAAHGARRERWPEPERALYDRCAAAPEALGVLADAERIDAFLDDWHAQVDDAALVARIVAATAEAPRAVPPAPRPPRRLAVWLSTGFLASAALGFVLGFAQAGAGGDEAAWDELMLGSNTAMEDFL